MIAFLRSNHFGILILCFLLLAVAGGMTCFFPTETAYSESHTPLANLLLDGLHTLGYNGEVFVMLFVLAVQAGLLVIGNQHFGLIPRIYFLPGFMYLLLACCFPLTTDALPALLFGLLFSVSLRYLMCFSQGKTATEQAFAATALTTIAGFFYIRGMCYVAIIWFSLLFLQAWSWRNIAGSLLGLIFPFILIFSILYLSDIPVEKEVETILRSMSASVPAFPLQPAFQWALAACTGCLLLAAVLLLRKQLQTAKGDVRKQFSLLTAMLLLTVSVFLLLPGLHPELYWIFIIPLSLFLSGLFTGIRTSR